MPDERVAHSSESFEPLWTTERDKYLLIRITIEPIPRYVILQIQEGLLLTIEDNEEFASVIGHMLKAGVQVMDIDDYVKKYAPNR